jgi:hypothetical protein
MIKSWFLGIRAENALRVSGAFRQIDTNFGSRKGDCFQMIAGNGYTVKFDFR